MFSRAYFPNRSMAARGNTEFRRRVDGAVEIWEHHHTLTFREPLAIIPANEWASIVSSMSTEGETGFTFGLVLAFHTGGTAYDADGWQHRATP